MAAGQLSGWRAGPLISTLIAVAAVAAVGLIFGKKGMLALTVIFFVGAVLSSERKTQWRLLGEVCRFVFVLLSLLLWVVTLSFAARSGFTAMVASTLLPGIAQAYWIGDLLAAGMHRAASLEWKFLLLGLDARDPLLRAARSFPNVVYPSRLYLAEWNDGGHLYDQLDGRPTYVEIATL